MGGVRRKLSLHLLFLKVPSAQKNQSIKMDFLGVACPELLQSYFGVAYSAILQYLYTIPNSHCLRAILIGR